MPYRTIDSVISELPRINFPLVPAPEYFSQGYKDHPKVGLAVESMKYHTTDEGWAIFKGLEQNGWKLYGHNLPLSITHVPTILRQIPHGGTILVQDEREWDVPQGNFRDPKARFNNPEALADRQDIFKLTILKDSHQRAHYHSDSAKKMGIHAWVCYYHPRLVKHLAPWIREEHLVRTYHSINAANVPAFSANRERGTLLSGAVSNAYPLRRRLFEGAFLMPDTVALPHPGYHRRGCHTPSFLIQLSKFKVAICTSSVYGYALRKIVEATACGCIVLTDLPIDEVMPEIDGNLVRITSDFTARRVGNILKELYVSYDAEKQEDFAKRATAWYNDVSVASRLDQDIESLRLRYKP